ncbi:hypothetical protein HanRHA438_Chr09g0396861 [Helianthus annuus]|nr:hypothetical protein HanRHA438_Chr09g0396861 [Helianthus annuus]
MSALSLCLSVIFSASVFLSISFGVLDLPCLVRVAWRLVLASGGDGGGELILIPACSVARRVFGRDGDALSRIPAARLA